MDHVKEEQNNIYYITVRLLERATRNNEIGLVSYFLGIFHVPGWLVSSASDLWKVVHGLRIQQVCLVNAFSIPRFQSLDLDFSPEFVRVRVFSDCCFFLLVSRYV